MSKAFPFFTTSIPLCDGWGLVLQAFRSAAMPQGIHWSGEDGYSGFWTASRLPSRYSNPQSRQGKKLEERKHDSAGGGIHFFLQGLLFQEVNGGFIENERGVECPFGLSQNPKQICLASESPLDNPDSTDTRRHNQGPGKKSGRSHPPRDLFLPGPRSNRFGLWGAIGCLQGPFIFAGKGSNHQGPPDGSARGME